MSCYRAIAIVIAMSLVAGAVAEDKKEITFSKEEQKIIDLTNQARAKEKLPPLKANPLLFKSALAHAKNMARQKKMDHVLDDKTPADRIEAAGYDWLECGENLAYWEQLVPETIVAGWMNSPPHRKEIMNAVFDEIGVSIVRIGDGKYYYVQNFGKQRTKPK